MKFALYFIAQITAKITAFVSQRLFGRGGETWPGEIALRICPNIFSFFPVFFKEVIFVVGTNGKTSTSKLLVESLQNAGEKVIYNPSGANLLNGIAANILLKLPFFPQKKYMAVFELDEYAFPQLIAKLKPTKIIFLNIYSCG